MTTEAPMKKEYQPSFYTIGEFASLLKIPTSTLRYYDEKDILTPEIRDANSNYRYYSENQVFEALSIIGLKKLGLPLNSIRAVLKKRRFEDLKEELKNTIDNLEENLKRIESQYQYTSYFHQQLVSSFEMIDEMLTETNLNEIDLAQAMADKSKGLSIEKEYEFSYVPQTSVVSFRYKKNPDLDTLNEAEARMKLQNYISDNGIVPSGPLTIVYNSAAEAERENEVSEVGLLYPIMPRPLKTEQVETFGGFWTCSTIHLGSLKEVPEIFKKLKKHIDSQGMAINGLPYEERLVDYMYLNNKEQFVTRVCYPIDNESR